MQVIFDLDGKHVVVQGEQSCIEELVDPCSYPILLVVGPISGAEQGLYSLFLKNLTAYNAESLSRVKSDRPAPLEPNIKVSCPAGVPYGWVLDAVEIKSDTDVDKIAARCHGVWRGPPGLDGTRRHSQLVRLVCLLIFCYGFPDVSDAEQHVN